MAQSATALVSAPETCRYPIGSLLGDISGIDFTTDLTDLKRRSRDYFWYSPILNEQLKDKLADIVVTPKDESEVIRVAAACAKYRIPLTVRGGATGNYGQCVPMEGGVVLDMAAMNAIEWQKPGKIRVQAGAKLWDIDAATRPNGWELRMHPSTKRSAQIGGFVAGGIGRRRQRHLRRHARARQHPRRAHRHAGGDAARDRTARRRGAEDQPRLWHHRHYHCAGNAAGARTAVDRRDRGVRRSRTGSEVRQRDCARRRRREKARLTDRMAAAAEFRRLPALLPGRQEPAARHDRRDVAGKLRDAAGSRSAARSPTSSRPRTCSTRCRSTSTPGTTPRCSS